VFAVQKLREALCYLSEGETGDFGQDSLLTQAPRLWSE